MRTEKMYDPKQDFYALKSFRYAGRELKRGDTFPSRDISNRNLLKLFQNGFVGYKSDFKHNKINMKEVDVVEEVKEEIPEEPVKTTEEAPAATKKKRGKKPKKAD